MSEKEQPPIMDQKLCVNGCGFFGSSQTSHMCSKCWKDAMSKSMRDADANTDGAGGSSAPFQRDSKLSPEEAAMPTSSVPPKPGTGSDSLLQNAPPPPSPASRTPPKLSSSPPDATAMMAVDSVSDVTAPPQPPPPPYTYTDVTATATPMAMAMEVTEEKEAKPVISMNAEAPDAVKASAVLVAPMVVCEGDQETTAALLAGAGAVAAVAGQAVMGAKAGGASAAPAIAAGFVASAAVAEAAGAAVKISASRPVQKNRKRCFTCNKKVGYTGIACRCNYVFCSLHRYPEQHDCTFDFKTSDRNDLKRTVVGGGQFSKLDRL